MLNKYVAGVLAIILGAFGIHRFYLGQRFFGILRIFAFIGLLMGTIESNADAPGVLLAMLFLTAFLEGVVFLVMPQEKFDQKYNKDRVPMALAAPAGNVNELKAEGVDYFRAGDYDLAMEAFMDALQVKADDPGVHFNLACCYAQDRSVSGALYHLELAISYGLPEPERIENHRALNWLRNQPAYEKFRENNFRRHDIKGTVPSQPSNSQEASLELKDISTPAADGPAVGPEKDLLAQLQTLGELRERGVLTEAEFAEQKEKLIG